MANAFFKRQRAVSLRTLKAFSDKHVCVCSPVTVDRVFVGAETVGTIVLYQILRLPTCTSIFALQQKTQRRQGSIGIACDHRWSSRTHTHLRSPPLVVAHTHLRSPPLVIAHTHLRSPPLVVAHTHLPLVVAHTHLRKQCHNEVKQHRRQRSLPFVVAVFA